MRTRIFTLLDRKPHIRFRLQMKPQKDLLQKRLKIGQEILGA